MNKMTLRSRLGRLLAMLLLSLFICPGRLMAAAETWKAGSWLPEMGDFTSRQRVRVQGSSAGIQSNVVLPLTLHYGSRIGPPEPGHLWLDGKCVTDFSDIRIYDDTGKPVPFTVAVQGNYDIVPDRRLGKDNLIVPRDLPALGLCRGDIIASRPGGVSMVAISHDNGANWQQRAGKVYMLRHLTASGVLIGLINSDGFYRSLDGGYSWERIYDLRMAGPNADNLYQGVTEDDLGNVYIGPYGGPWDDFSRANHAKVLKITAERICAPLWDDSFVTEVFQAGTTTPVTDNNWQMHCVQADPFRPGHIYAIGCDPMPAIYQSTDYGATWSTLRGGALAKDDYCDTIDIAFTQDYIYFAGGGSMQTPSSSIYRWNRDTEWVKLFKRGAPLANLFRLGNNWYGCTMTRSPDQYPRIWRSSDIADDSRWTVVGVGGLLSPIPSNSMQLAGWFYASGVGVPHDDDEQCIVAAGNCNSTGDYPPLRFYDGGDHHYALLYVKIPSVPPTGASLHVYYSNPSATSVAVPLDAIFTDAQPTSSLVAHWSFDAYDGGNTLLADIGPSGTITGTTGGSPQVVPEQGSMMGPLLRSTRDGQHMEQSPGTRFFKLSNVPGDALDLDQNFTILAWVKIDTLAAAQDFNFLIAKGWNETMQYGLYVSRPTCRTDRGILGFRYNTAGSSTSVHNNSGPPVGDGNWQQVGIIVGSRSGTYPSTSSQTCRFIVNGVVGDEQTLNGPGIKKMTASDGNSYLNVAIGAMAHPTTTVSPFLGSYDDIRVYNTELTAAQVQALYEQRAVAVPEVSLGNPLPSLQIGRPSGAMTNRGSVSYTVTYDGADSISLSQTDVVLNRTGTANGVVSISGTDSLNRTITVSSITGKGTLGISVTAGTAVDTEGYTSPAAGPSQTFIVDDTPPESLSCQCDAYPTSITSLHARWSAVDTESGVSRYEYAIGTSPLATDIRGWSSAGPATDYTITGLSLRAGTPYYISVRATNAVGLTSNPVSSGAINVEYAAAVTSALPDGEPVAMSRSLVVTAVFPDCFYIEDPDRVAGIRVQRAANDLHIGQSVSVSGTLGRTTAGERAILSPVFTAGSMSTQLKPLSLVGRFVGGRTLGSTPGITDGKGLNNVGILIRIAGRVSAVTADGFYVDDGSRLKDTTGATGIQVWTGVSGSTYQNASVVVTGPVSLRNNGGAVMPVILATQIVRT